MNLPTTALVPSFSSAAPTALKDKQVKWLLSLSPSCWPWIPEGSLGKLVSWREAGLHVTLSMPEPLSCQTPNEGCKLPFKSQVLCLLKAQLLNRKRIILFFSQSLFLSFFSVSLLFKISFSIHSSQVWLFLASRCFCLCISQLVSPSLAVPVVLSVFILPFSPFPAFSVTLHPPMPNQAPSPASGSLCLRPAGDLNAGPREGGGGRRGAPERPAAARGPARVGGGAEAQPHPRRRCSRDPGLIWSR